ncbi:head-tail connector protein [Brevundimonas sp. 2R-24]|uniref:Head-tail connector protein n=1 Tax=Peiella sedimenti TaxID=3061083 RepID=A0ABT8SNX8_9CAUL|nr:head-tail connector protein [Caulobacteraceae bacterium XZ-24]
MWNRLTRVEAPAEPLLTTAEAKAQLRVTHDEDDALIDGLISTATAFIEGPNGCGLAPLTQTWRLSLDGFPAGPITLPLSPVQAVEAITYTDEAGESRTLAAYAFDADVQPGKVWPAYQASWPAARLAPGSVKVTFTTGYGDASDVPADLKHAALMLVGHLYENREATAAVALSEVPMGVEAILSRYRALPVG